MKGSVSAERSSNFYLGFLFLSRDRREALADVYAFCREADDLADSGELDRKEAARRLDAWGGEIERMYRGEAREPLSLRLQAHLARYKFPKDAFLGVLDGMRMDLEGARFKTYAELETYMTRVASCVGYLCIEIFGYRHRSAREYARLLGHAFQLTNILRDVGADIALGRLYFPAEDLARFGCSEDEIRARVPTPGFMELMRFEISRAERLYASAAAVLDPEDRVSMRPAGAMTGVYAAILKRIAASPDAVLSGRVEPGRLAKLSAAFRGWRG